MRSFPTYIVVVLSIGSTLATATQFHKRQTPTNCRAPAANSEPALLAVRPLSDPVNGPITYVSTVSGVKHAGIDGQQDSLLVTKDSNGKAVPYSEWEFLPCGTQSVGETLVGIVRPRGGTQHCLALESTNDTAKGSRNSLVDSYCTQVAPEYRLFNQTSTENEQGGINYFLTFADQKTTVIVSNTGHGEIQLFTGGTTSTHGEPMQLQLIQGHEN